MRCAIYLRISDDQSGKKAGVDRQREACQALAERRDWTVVEVFVDNDISAFTGKTRPGFEAMLKAIERGQVEAVVAWHTDRIYRKVKDLLRLLEASPALEIRTVEGGDIDLSNPTGRMVATILGGVSTNESEHHAERRRAANLKRAVDGEWLNTGFRTFGFNTDGTHREPEASMIRKAAREIIAGKSLSTVAREWNASGVTTVRAMRKWSNLNVRRVITNPRVAALRVHQGKVIGTGNWQPIIDEATWRGLSSFLADPSRKNSVSFERFYLGSGVYRCGYRAPDADPDDPDSICGRRLYAAHPHGINRSMVYCCRPVVHLARNGSELDRYVETTAFNHLLENAVGGDLRQAEDQVDVAKLITQRDARQDTKDQLATLLRKGSLDMASVEREAAILTKEIADLNAQMATAAQSSPAAMLLEDGEDPEALADEALLTERWTKASPDIKGKIISMLFDVVVLPAPRGRLKFDHDLIDIRWHRPHAETAGQSVGL
jgi:site-specific DNA recombinase